MHNKYQTSKQSAQPSTRLDRTISWTLVRSSKQMRGSKKKRERAGDRESVITWKNNNELEYDLCWLVLNDLCYYNTVNWFVNLTHLHCCEKDRTRYKAYKYWRLLMIMFSFHQLAVPFCFSWFVPCLFIFFLSFFFLSREERKTRSHLVDKKTQGILMLCNWVGLEIKLNKRSSRSRTNNCTDRVIFGDRESLRSAHRGAFFLFYCWSWKVWTKVICFDCLC